MILPNPKTKSNEDFICKVSAKSFNAADRRISKSLVIRDVVPPSINPQQQSLVSSTDSNKKSVTIVGTLEQGEISIPPDIFNIDAILCDSMQAVKVTGKRGIEAHSTKRFGIFKLILDEGNGNLLGKKEANHIDRIIDSSSPVTASGDDQGRL
ncbi:hypothetical protein V6N13_023991 [Hibiscus sabdariffa]